MNILNETSTIIQMQWLNCAQVNSMWVTVMIRSKNYQHHHHHLSEIEFVAILLVSKKVSLF
jgi:hypothetical protein